MDFLTLFFENGDAASKMGFGGLAIGIIAFQWYVIMMLNKSFSKKIEDLIQVEKDIIKEFAVTNHAIQEIANSNAKMNEQLYQFLMNQGK